MNFGQLDRTGQSAVAILVLAIVFWVADVLPAGVTGILALAMLMVAGVPSSLALGGFATSAFWMLVAVLFFGTAMVNTGLAKRLSYRVLLVSRPTYGGILVAFMTAGFILALGVPSITVRTSILVPIAVALVHALDLPRPGPGAALIVLSAFEMAVLPGCAVLTGSLWGPFISGLFASAKWPLTWVDYARAMAVPTAVWCGLVLGVNLLVLRPAPAASMSTAVIRRELERLGPFTRPELATALIIMAAVAGWVAQPWHGIPPEAIGMLALVLLFASRVLGPNDIGGGIPWGLVILIGAMFGLGAVISAYRINVWMQSYIVTTIQPFASGFLPLTVAVCAAVAVMRLVEPLGFITIAAFLLSLGEFLASRGIPPLVSTALILFPVHVFWFNYQNIWLVMTDGFSQRAAYTQADRLKLATAFFGATIVALWLGFVYWRAVGLIG